MAGSKRIVQKTWLAIFVSLALIFVVILFRNDRDRVLEILRADARFLALAAVAQLLCFLVVVITWQRALATTTRKPVNFLEAGSQVLLLNFGKYIPGKIWGLAARGARLSQLGYRLDEIASASLVEQFLLAASGFWLAFLAASLLYGEQVYVLLLLLTTITIALFRHAIPVAAKLAHRFNKSIMVEGRFTVRVSAIGLLTLLTGYISIWLFLTLTFVAFVSSLVDIGLTLRTLGVLLLSLTAGYVAGLVTIFAPGGVGVREGVGAALLSSLVSLDEAILLMLLFRVWAVSWELFAGFAVVSLRKFRRVAAENSRD